jgi:hypothetical protein
VRRHHTPISLAGLPCSGIARTFPRALVYGLIEYQGLGIPNLYINQGLSHIERILKYSHLDDDIPGQLIRASVEQLKLEIGCNGLTLSLPYVHFSKLATKCWIRQTWQFMNTYQIRIEDTSPDISLGRANDQLLIPLFHETGLRDDHLHRLNLCWPFSFKFSRSLISQPGAALRLAKLHGRGTGTRHALPTTNGPRRGHPVFRTGYCGEHP